MARRKKQVEINVNTYRVAGTPRAISHGQNVYVVKDGLIELPASETWYADLIAAGVLTQVEDDEQ